MENRATQLVDVHMHTTRYASIRAGNISGVVSGNARGHNLSITTEGMLGHRSMVRHAPNLPAEKKEK